MFWPKGRHLVYNSTNFPSLLIIFPNFFHNILYITWQIVNIPRCVCTHPIDLMGIHLLCCVHNNEHKGTHDVIYGRHFCRHYARCWFSHATRTITYTSFNHIELLLLTSWHCAYQKWHLHLSECCHCRPNVTRFISLNLHNLKIFHLQCNSSQGPCYYNRHLTNQFLPLAIEVFDCLDKHANVFLHNCVNAIWSLKWIEGLHFLPWSLFFVNCFWSHYKGCKHLSS
jgi:hypothetical protein